MRYGISGLAGCVLVVSSAVLAGGGFSPADSERMVASFRHLRAASPGAWAYSVFTESASQRSVQFYAHQSAVSFDFPVSNAIAPDARPGPYKDGRCTSQVPKLGFAARIEVQMPEAEQKRLGSMLDARHTKWRHEYCLSLDRAGVLVGYSHSITGDVEFPPEQVPDFVLAVFREVYGLEDIRTIAVDQE